MLKDVRNELHVYDQRLIVDTEYHNRSIIQLQSNCLQLCINKFPGSCLQANQICPMNNLNKLGGRLVAITSCHSHSHFVDIFFGPKL